MVNGLEGLDRADHSVLIVGCGSIGKRHARVLRQLGVKNIGLCDPDRTRIDETIAQIGPAPAYAHLDDAMRLGYRAAMICTPPDLHVRQLIDCIRGGCDVFCEKPLANDFSELDELQNLLPESNKILMVGLCFRYHEGLRRVKSLIGSQIIGRLLSIRAIMGEDLATARPGVDYRKLFVAKEETGIVLDLCHEPDFIQWVANREAVRATARHGKISDLDMQGDDFAAMILQLEQDIFAEIHLDFFSATRRRCSEYVGTEGIIELDMSDWDRSQIRLFTRTTCQWTTESMIMERDDMFRAMDQEFLDCIETRKQPSVSLAQGVQLLEMIIGLKKHDAWQRKPE